MMTPITAAQAEAMRTTLRQRSDSYIDFALQVAIKTGDTLAVELYEAEQERRDVEAILSMVPVLGPIPTWKD